MNKNLLTLGLATSCVLMSAASAQAGSFFEFHTNASDPGPDTIITLESIIVDGDMIDDFVFANPVELNVSAPNANGPASPDATEDDRDAGAPSVEVPNPDLSEVKETLHNPFLSRVIDTEDNAGFYSMTLAFEKAIDSLLVFERGGRGGSSTIGNSDLQFIVGGVTYDITRNMWKDTGVDLRTREIGSNIQNLGSLGIKFDDAVKEITVINKAGFNGPDWKVIGVAKVPEPATMLGLGVVAGAGFLASRRKRAEA